MAEKPYHNPFGGLPEQRAHYEYYLALDCVLPRFDRWGIDSKDTRVLDLGCGSGGLSVALAERGANCLGIDHSKERIDSAARMAAQHGVVVRFLVGDVLRMDCCDELFDLVILSELVEHLVNLRNLEDLLQWSQAHLASEGKLYVSFPPWFSPFAGHQAGWSGIRYVPWYHLMPDALKRLLVPKQAPAYIDYHQELNRLTLGAFERIAARAGLNVARCDLYLLRPEYNFRYGIPPVRLPLLARFLPIRELITMGAYYLLVGS